MDKMSKWIVALGGVLGGIYPLLKIKDSYPKLLITRTRYPKYDIDGVLVVDIADWLLEKA